MTVETHIGPSAEDIVNQIQNLTELNVNLEAGEGMHHPSLERQQELLLVVENYVENHTYSVINNRDTAAKSP